MSKTGFLSVKETSERDEKSAKKWRIDWNGARERYRVRSFERGYSRKSSCAEKY